MPVSRRCRMCDRLIDPLHDEAYLVCKGKGSLIKDLHRVLWLCPKHGAAYEKGIEDAREALLAAKADGKIAAGNAANGEVK